MGVFLIIVGWLFFIFGLVDLLMIVGGLGRDPSDLTLVAGSLGFAIAGHFIALGLIMAGVGTIVYRKANAQP